MKRTGDSVRAPAAAVTATTASTTTPAAAVVDDDLQSGLGMPMPAVDFKKENNQKTTKSRQLEKTSGDEMSIAHGAGLIDKLGLKRRKVKGDGSCWVYAILECAGLLERSSRLSAARAPRESTHV